MIDLTVWGPIILKITAEQRYFLKKEFGITEVDLRLQSLQKAETLQPGYPHLRGTEQLQQNRPGRNLYADEGRPH